MTEPTIALSTSKLTRIGLHLTGTIHYQLSPDELVKHTLRREEGVLGETGALLIRTGEFTGRSPGDRFIVKDASTAEHIHWNDFNQPMEERYFDIILQQTVAWLNQSPELYIRDSYVCADPRYRLNIRVINETPAINLFAYNMFLRPTEKELDDFNPDWQVLSAPGLKLDPAACGTRHSNAVVISFRHKMILLVGTGYTGETKKAVFTILNYLLPQEKKVLSMHCSANVGQKGTRPSSSGSAAPARPP